MRLVLTVNDAVSDEGELLRRIRDCIEDAFGFEVFGIKIICREKNKKFTLHGSTVYESTLKRKKEELE